MIDRMVATVERSGKLEKSFVAVVWKAYRTLLSVEVDQYRNEMMGHSLHTKSIDIGQEENTNEQRNPQEQCKRVRNRLDALDTWTFQ